MSQTLNGRLSEIRAAIAEASTTTRADLDQLASEVRRHMSDLDIAVPHTPDFWLGALVGVEALWGSLVTAGSIDVEALGDQVDGFVIGAEYIRTELEKL